MARNGKRQAGYTVEIRDDSWFNDAGKHCESWRKHCTRKTYQDAEDAMYALGDHPGFWGEKVRILDYFGRVVTTEYFR